MTAGRLVSLWVLSARRRRGGVPPWLEHLDDDAAAVQLGDRAGLFVDVAAERVHGRDDEHIARAERAEQAHEAVLPRLERLGRGMPEPLDRHAEPRQLVALLGHRGHVVARDDEADQPRTGRAGEPPVAVLLQLGEALRAVRGRGAAGAGGWSGCAGRSRARRSASPRHPSSRSFVHSHPDSARRDPAADPRRFRLVVEPQLEAELVGVELGERVAQRGGAECAVATTGCSAAPHRLDHGEAQFEHVVARTRSCRRRAAGSCGCRRRRRARAGRRSRRAG